MMRGKLLAALTVLVGAAGSLFGSAPTVAAATSASAGAATMRYEHCYEQVVVAPVPVETLDVDLPAGFTPMTLDPAGTTAVYVLVGLDCRLDHAGGEPVTDFLHLLAVDVPDEHTSDEVSQYYVVLDGYTSHEGVAKTFSKWCMADEISHGDVVMSTTVTPAGRTGQVTASGTRGDFTLDTVVPGGEPAAGDAGALRVFRVSTTRVLGAIQVDFTGAVSLIGKGVAVHDGVAATSPGLGIHVFPDDVHGPNTLTLSSYVNDCHSPDGAQDDQRAARGRVAGGRG